MSFKIATWNVNSLRVRLPHVLEWLTNVKPDVLALQETKLPDVDFPLAEIQRAGYHAVFSGQRAYNGVAILSRIPGSNITTELPVFEVPQRRILSMSLGDLRVVNIYLPNGESVVSEKFHYKMQWIAALDAMLLAELKLYPKMIVLGDFNIAPADEDVFNPAELQDQVLCSEPERSAFQRLLQLGFADCFRLHAQPEKSYSWWDYRMNAFKRNRGLRIDHILASKPLISLCQKCQIDQTPRALDRPSDHAPVVAEYDFSVSE